jgi:hypothetical protein
VNALANKEVGAYLNRYFVSSFQKIGTFRVVNHQKQGGNVASYFCTPAGGVLDAIAGPVDAATLLREARWVVETRKMALLASGGNVDRYRRVLRLAHAQQLPARGELARINWRALPLYRPSPAGLASVLETTPGVNTLDNQGRVHLLLAAFPLPKLEQTYRVIYEKILKEKVSTAPVAVEDTRLAKRAGTSWSGGGTVSPSLFADDLDGPNRSLTRPDRHRQRQLKDLALARNDPPARMTYSGRALNSLLADLEAVQAQGAQGPAVPVSASVLKHLNVTSGAGGGNFGLFKSGGPLQWPLAWREKPLAGATKTLRARIESLVRQTLARVKGKKDHAALLTRLGRAVDQLGAVLKHHVDDLEAPDYISANHFLQELGDAVTALKQSDAARYVDGTFRPDPHQIKTVQDLVKFMADHGLTFAPASRGDESAYVALRRGLAAADTAGSSGATLDGGEL